MVHLARVSRSQDNDVAPELKQLQKKLHSLELKYDIDDEEDSFSASVYGSKFATRDLPKNEMPEREMPKEVAYRLIKDDLSLDGAPTLKYGPSRSYRT